MSDIAETVILIESDDDENTEINYAETELISDDDEVLAQRRSRRRGQYRRRCEHLRQEQQQQIEQPSAMMMMQALLQMQQTNQHIEQTQQQTTAQILQILQVLQEQSNRSSAYDVRLKRLENGGACRDAGPAVRYLRAVQSTEPAPADAGQRHHAKYTPDEDRRIVEYLIEMEKIDRAKSKTVWEEMRREDPVIGRRPASGLRHRFKSHIWPKIMAGHYTGDPQILHKFRRIWPERLFQAP